MGEIESKNGKTQQQGENALSYSSLGRQVYVKIAVIGLLFYFLFHHQIDIIVRKWADPSWSHGILIPFFSLYFLHQSKKELISLKPKCNVFGLFALIGCILFYIYNFFFLHVGYFNQAVILPTLLSIVFFIGGWVLLKYTWLPIMYLFFAIPLPAAIYNDITIPMRKLAAAVATELLNLVPQLEAEASGVVINVIYKGIPLYPPLDVAEACSGMRLLMAFVALGVAMAYLHARPIWQRLVLLASTIPIAIFCNVVRVTITGFIYILWDPKYAQGFWHDALGMAMLPLAFGLYALISWIMNNLLVEERSSTEQDVIVRKNRPENDKIES